MQLSKSLKSFTISFSILPKTFGTNGREKTSFELNLNFQPKKVVEMRLLELFSNNVVFMFGLRTIDCRK